MNWWVSNYLERPDGLIWLTAIVFWVIGSIVLHELAHGWTATAFGDPTPRLTGHLTWNPLVHMGVPSLVMFALVGIAWGAMPVDPTRMRGRYAAALVSAAGPAMNFVLAALSTLCLGVWTGITGHGLLGTAGLAPHIVENFTTFFFVGASYNVVLMLFNLLPIPPLDGSKILVEVFRSLREPMESQAWQGISTIVFVLIFFFGGSAFFGLAGTVVTRSAFAITRLF